MSIYECAHKDVPKWVTPQGIFCFDCMRPEEWQKYPGAYEREVARRERAERARQNLHPAKGGNL